MPPPTPPNPPFDGNKRPKPEDRDLYVLKLDYDGYKDFAKFIIQNSIHQKKKPDAETDIENWLKAYDEAKVVEFCDNTVERRHFGKDWNGKDVKDVVVVNHDSPINNQGQHKDHLRVNVSLPYEFCEENNSINLKYLEDYVDAMANDTNPSEAAWALLGMYFLSRCR